MTRTTVTVLVVGAMCVLACGAGSEPQAAVETEGVPKEADALPVLLDRPFTAEQIRDEWTVGFELRVRRWTPAAEVFEVWTVVAADPDGVEIESRVMDEAGEALGDPSSQRSTWVELRDHASFPVDRAIREKISRETPLGELDGWLYTVGEPGGEVATEFFFAETMPGAPVFVHVLKGGDVVEIFEQLERTRP